MSDRPVATLPGLAFVIDLGGLALLLSHALTAPFRRGADAPPLFGAIARQASWMIAAGLPLVIMVHVSIGSFLAMQSYYGATFKEAAGPVVGLGLVRNVAPLLTGFVLVGLIASKVTADLRGGPRPGLDDDPRSRPDRDAVAGVRPDDRPIADAGRLALSRIGGAVIAGPVLTTIGAGAGSAMGMTVSRTMLGLAPSIFIGKFLEMLMPADVVGILVKGALFAGMAALLASYEGLRPLDSGRDCSPHRAAVRGMLMILLINVTWFQFVYLAGSPYGPNVVAAPAG